MDNTQSGLVKISANLPTSTFETLKALARSRNTSMTEVLRQAIATENYLATEVNRGSRIVVQSQSAPPRELIFRGQTPTQGYEP
jgi:hypothetical protein